MLWMPPTPAHKCHEGWGLLKPTNLEEPAIAAITTIGLNIANQSFKVHGVDNGGKVVVRRQLERRCVLAFFSEAAAMFGWH